MGTSNFSKGAHLCKLHKRSTPKLNLICVLKLLVFIDAIDMAERKEVDKKELLF